MSSVFALVDEAPETTMATVRVLTGGMYVLPPPVTEDPGEARLIRPEGGYGAGSDSSSTRERGGPGKLTTPPTPPTPPAPGFVVWEEDEEEDL